MDKNVTLECNNQEGLSSKHSTSPLSLQCVGPSNYLALCAEVPTGRLTVW